MNAVGRALFALALPLTGVIDRSCAQDKSGLAGSVQLRVPPDLAKDVAALPRPLNLDDPATRRVTTALGRLDEEVLKAIRECRTMAGGRSFYWERGIDVSMRGPRFLSYVIHDNQFCGGAHPNTSTMSIVYDLQSGAPVDWTKLLPASLTGKLALAEGADGSKMVTLASKTLFRLYEERYRPRQANAKGADDDADCRSAIKEAGTDGPPAMMAWLDAKENGLAVEFDLAHVVQACADPIVIPTSVLRSEGASSELTDALDAAHAAGARSGK